MVDLLRGLHARPVDSADKSMTPAAQPPAHDEKPPDRASDPAAA
jgi:hypothetical protein